MTDDMSDERITALLRTLERHGAASNDIHRRKLKAAVLDEFDAMIESDAVLETQEPTPDEADAVLVDVWPDPRAVMSSRRAVPRWLPWTAGAAAAAAVLLALLWSDGNGFTITEQQPAVPGPGVEDDLADPAREVVSLGALSVAFVLPEGLEIQTSGGGSVVVRPTGAIDGGEEIWLAEVDAVDLDAVVGELLGGGDVSGARLQIPTASGSVGGWDLTLASGPDCAAAGDCAEITPDAPQAMALRAGANHRVVLLEGGGEGDAVLVLIRGPRISEFTVLASALLETLTVVE